MMATKWVLVGVIAACNTVGDVLNTAGMKRQGEVAEFGPRSLFHMIAAILRNRFVLGGLAALCVSFVALLMLLSVANVSFAVPATAISYVLETLLAKHVLKEDVGRKRWAAATLVALGVLLLLW
jgi:bacterial/archaeal transporter family protein